MGQILQADDFKIDMFITVHTGQMDETISEDFNMKEGVQSTSVLKIEDKNYKGRVLRIRAINLPFIVVEFLTGDNNSSFISFDTREYKLIKLSDEYVKALEPYFLEN
jgi:hypothetical protein